MRSLETNAEHRRQRESGFSMIELVMVLAISIIITAASMVSFETVMKQQRVTNAYNTTLSAMRRARDNAVSQSTSYQVTFSNTSPAPLSNLPSITVSLAPGATGFSGDQSTVTYQLPFDISFQTNAAITATAAPDGFGTAARAIDFGYTATNTTVGGQSTIYFCSDGSAQIAACATGSFQGNFSNNWDQGVVYMARTGELMSSRAVSLWGATGRIHGWRLYNVTNTTYQWVRQ